MRLMRAAVLEPDAAEVTIEEIPVPEPGRGEVLLKVAACGVCHTDLHVGPDELGATFGALERGEILGRAVAAFD